MKILQAKYSGRCSVSGAKIAKGDTVVSLSGRRGVILQDAWTAYRYSSGDLGAVIMDHLETSHGKIKVRIEPDEEGDPAVWIFDRWRKATNVIRQSRKALVFDDWRQAMRAVHALPKFIRTMVFVDPDAVIGKS
jgi:hypothetical protein